MHTRRIILGIKYGAHDCAAALTVEGVLAAACEQERYTRDKHSRRFPSGAIDDCLAIASLGMDDVDEIAFAGDMKFLVREFYLRLGLEFDERMPFLVQDVEKIRRCLDMERIVREYTRFTGPISFHRHHLCHLASAYYPSGFPQALVVSHDGKGEIDASMLATGRDGVLTVFHDANRFPHSLGFLYAAVTHYLGWKHHCDEGIVMGLAPYGDPMAKVHGADRSHLKVFEEILRDTGTFGYEVDQSWMAYFRERDVWISRKFLDVFGPARSPEGPVEERHAHVAAALQRRVEDVVLTHLRRARRETGLNRLAYAGGLALNCSLNYRLAEENIFDEIFVQPASGDAGTAIGACFLASRNAGFDLRPAKGFTPYLGSRFDEEHILSALRASGLKHSRPRDIFAEAAGRLKEGKIVAWFQGAAEFGPRALGNRSILARPYPAAMKDHINERVKFRENFRPFAPAVLAERAGEYFLLGQKSPHMLIAADVLPEKREFIPAVVHVDGSCRVQTVSGEDNERFRRLLEAFDSLTGVPVLLNTSFNVKGQPIVNTPEQALECFTATDIDCLALGDYLLEK